MCRTEESWGHEPSQAIPSPSRLGGVRPWLAVPRPVPHGQLHEALLSWPVPGSWSPSKHTSRSFTCSLGSPLCQQQAGDVFGEAGRERCLQLGLLHGLEPARGLGLGLRSSRRGRGPANLAGARLKALAAAAPRRLTPLGGGSCRPKLGSASFSFNPVNRGAFSWALLFCCSTGTCQIRPTLCRASRPNPSLCCPKIQAPFGSAKPTPGSPSASSRLCTEANDSTRCPSVPWTKLQVLFLLCSPASLVLEERSSSPSSFRPFKNYFSFLFWTLSPSPCS